MIEKLTIQNARFKIHFDIYFVWFTYFPFIGWIYPFIFKKNDKLAMHHAKQAFIMAAIFTVVPILLTFSMVIVPISSHVVRFIFVIIIYLSHLSYFALCTHGFLKMKDNNMYKFPIVMKYANKLNI